MDRKEIEFSRPEEQSIDVITGTTYSETLSQNELRPITIFHDNEPAKDKAPKASKPVLIIEVPRHFPYKSKKMVPWDYNYNYTNEVATVDLVRVGGMTRSGHYYSPVLIEKVTLKKLLVPISK